MPKPSWIWDVRLGGIWSGSLRFASFCARPGKTADATIARRRTSKRTSQWLEGDPVKFIETTSGTVSSKFLRVLLNLTQSCGDFMYVFIIAEQRRLWNPNC